MFLVLTLEDYKAHTSFKICDLQDHQRFLSPKEMLMSHGLPEGFAVQEIVGASGMKRSSPDGCGL